MRTKLINNVYWRFDDQSKRSHPAPFSLQYCHVKLKRLFDIIVHIALAYLRYLPITNETERVGNAQSEIDQI